MEAISLSQSGLFAGMSEEEAQSMLTCLNADKATYEKGEMVLWEGETVERIGVILAGHGRSIKDDPSGKTVIVTLLEPGSLIGVLLAASRGRKSPVSVQALERMTVLFIPMKRVAARCARGCPRHELLLRNVLVAVAEKALVLHDRNDCLIRPTVREKLLTYLKRTAKERGSREFTIPFDRAALAEYLNVDRSALSRELSRMRREGLLDVYKNQFILPG